MGGSGNVSFKLGSSTITLQCFFKILDRGGRAGWYSIEKTGLLLWLFVFSTLQGPFLSGLSLLFELLGL